MDIQITFDNEYVAQTPTFALCTRGGKYIGAIPATDITVKPNWNAQSDLVLQSTNMTTVCVINIGIILKTSRLSGVKNGTPVLKSQ